MIAFASTCFLSSSIYIFNDIVDYEKDRHHPKKKHRPIASGKLSMKIAFIGGVLFLALAAALGIAAGKGFLKAAGAYFVLQAVYSTYLKHIVILDIIAIAAGFVLRAVAGAWAINVAISPWLLICAALLALFLASAKRRHELLLLEDVSSDHRPVLNEYSLELLDEITSTISSATITTYALYTFFSRSGKDYLMMVTIPFVVYGILRYQYLIHTKNEGGSPEDILIKDRPLIINILLWILTAIYVLYLR